MNSLRARILQRRITPNTMKRIQMLATSTSVNSSEIQIPARKERGPTDILKALETTINHDPTAAHYKYLDDPFLIPKSLNEKRMYSLSKESGKRAAMWVLEEHADLLRSELSEPLVTAFLPPEKYENKSQVSEEILMTLIKQARISDVLHVYKLLEENVSIEAKQAILELLCFYNSNEEIISELFLEERSYLRETEIRKAEWVNSPVVEKLFGELKNNETTAAAAYNALICGTAKYLKVDRAWSLYNECKDKNLPIFLTTYNYIIPLSNIMKDNNEERKLLLLSTLQDMAKSGLKPTIHTLNATLKTVSQLQSQTLATDLAISLLSEFRSAGIKPCLASYYYLLVTFCREKCPTSSILLNILDELEKKDELVVQDAEDKKFFVKAMEVASKHLFNLEAGYRLHNLLLTKNNYKLVGSRSQESTYYRHYLQLILYSEDIDKFMEVYDDLVPNIYVPEPFIIKNIIETLELTDKNKCMELLPKILSHIVMFDIMDRQIMMQSVLKLLTKHGSPPKDSPLNKTYAEFAWTLWVHIQTVDQMTLQRNLWNANVYGYIGILVERGGEFEKLLEVINFLVKSQASVVGVLNTSTLLQFFDACVVRGHAEGALSVLKYAFEYRLNEVNSMAKILKQNIPLSEAQEIQLISLVGEKTVESKS